MAEKRLARATGWHCNLRIERSAGQNELYLYVSYMSAIVAPWSRRRQKEMMQPSARAQSVSAVEKRSRSERYVAGVKGCHEAILVLWAAQIRAVEEPVTVIREISALGPLLIKSFVTCSGDIKTYANKQTSLHLHLSMETLQLPMLRVRAVDFENTASTLGVRRHRKEWCNLLPQNQSMRFESGWIGSPTEEIRHMAE